MITQEMVPKLIGRQAYDRQGDKVGKIGQVYVDDRQGTPMWATVNTGLFGNNESFVPLGSATAPDGDLKLDVTKDQVKNAPQVGHDENQLSATEEGQLRSHYGQQSAGGQGSNPDAAAGRHDADRGRKDAEGRSRGNAAGQGTDDAEGRAERGPEGGMTRSEERLRVGTESEETGTVRLRKYVVTEDQQVTVPVSHEEVRLEREPVTGNQNQGKGTLDEDEQQVTLHAERATVDKTVEDVEKVRLNRETVSDEETVSDTVRKEQVDVDDPNDQLHGRRDK